ncbi:MAG: lysine--tRNA ligase [bacterium]
MDNIVGSSEKEIIEYRSSKASELRAMGTNPYPSKTNRTISASALCQKQDQLIETKETVVVAGRLMAMRGHGKLLFVDIRDESGKIQAVFRSDVLGEDKFKFISFFDLGDFIEASGTVFITKAGETSIEVHDSKILSKAIRPLPDSWSGIKDEETLFRKRYLDLMLNPEVKELFYKKAKFWQATRNFLINKGFLEVETPALENTAGGADAQPFVTHHNALDIDVYLRISMGELWQKRLMVAGFEKTFEIGRQFRNEGISREHLQDYSQMEFYWGYANYEDSMKLVEEMYKYIAEATFGTQKFKIGEFDVDLSGQWPKIDFVTVIKEKQGIDVLAATDDEIREKLRQLNVKFSMTDQKGRLMDLLWKQIRKTIAGPALLINHPVEVSPLAKRMETNPSLVERYQVILAGSEMGNGYSELNDPVDQAMRFEEQAKMREDGDAEAQMHDRDFVEALEYGMPPTSGFGFSERLFSFLADKSGREAQLFPLMRPYHIDIDKESIEG